MTASSCESVDVERDEIFIHQIAHFRLERLEQKLANPDVVDQLAAIIDDVDHVERFGVLAMFADVIEHFLAPSNLRATAIRSGVIKRPTLPSG